MFVRADQLLQEHIEGKLPFHVLEYYWDRFNPRLLYYDIAEGEARELELESAKFVVGRARNCTGRFDGDDYVPCPAKAALEGAFSQCPACAEESFIPFQECVFDPRCEGEKCDVEFCRREHVLYLAFYNTLAKIGLSSTRRVDRRLIEQGADAFAIVGSYPNRFRAREAEKAISARLGIPQGIRQQKLLNSYSAPLNIRGIEERYRSLKGILEDSFDLRAEPLRALEGYPITLPLPGTPKLMETAGTHRGELLGVKGRWLIYEHDGIRALNMSDLPGRRIVAEK